MVTAEVQRLQGLIANREAQILQLTPILGNLEAPRTGLKIEVSDLRARQAKAIRQQIQGFNESIINLKADLIQEQLKPDIEIEPIITTDGVIIPEIEVKPQNNTLRNILLVGGALLLIL